MEKGGGREGDRKLRKGEQNIKINIRKEEEETPKGKQMNEEK